MQLIFSTPFQNFDAVESPFKAAPEFGFSSQPITDVEACSPTFKPSILTLDYQPSQHLMQTRT